MKFLAKPRTIISTAVITAILVSLCAVIFAAKAGAVTEERVIATGIADNSNVQGAKYRKVPVTVTVQETVTFKLQWTGNADLDINVLRGSTRLARDTSAANPKSLSVSLTPGTNYDVAVWATSGVGDFSLSMIATFDNPPPPPVTIENVPSVIETTPTTASGDTADDPAIWVNPLDPSLSLVIGNNKKGSLETYNLSGGLVQRITSTKTFWGNVDTRGNYVTAVNSGIRIYQVDPSTRLLSRATENTSGTISTSGEGSCMYDPGEPGVVGGLYVFSITRDVGRVRQYQLADQDGDRLLTSSLVRDFTVGTEAEGCVANDTTGDLFISEEDVALWRYGANPSDGSARTMVAPVNSALFPADAEGVTLASGYLFVSAQNVVSPQSNWVNVYSATAPYEFVKSFRVSAGTNSDDCDQTDGIAAYSGNLGAEFPGGIFVCQDGYNALPGFSGNQNFKFARFETIGL